MDYRDFAARHEAPQLHFWYRARLKLIESLCEQVTLPGSARILDVGCGTGTEIPLLTRYGEVTALDVDQRALHEVAKQNCTVVTGDITRTTFPQASFDLACCFDVLEHIEDDVAALRTIHDVLSPGGALLITVPAFKRLCGDHDRALAHFRRYEKAELIARLRATGFHIQRVRYWNSLLFPLIALLRIAKNTFRHTLHINSQPVSEAARPLARLINTALYHVLALESAGPLVSMCARLPFGLSLAVVAKKI